MTAIGRAKPDPNHHKGMIAYDDVSGEPFAVQGDETTGSINVIVTDATTANPSAATVTSVSDTASSAQLIAANTNRREIEFQNNSSSILYLLKGSGTASATNFTVYLEQGDYYSTSFRGAFQGVWSANSTGAVLITES